MPKMRALFAILALGLTSVLWADSAPKVPLILKGIQEDGIRYYLIRDKDKKPSMSVDGSPLYEGVKKDINNPFRVIVSKEFLDKGGYLERLNSQERFFPWSEENIRAFVSKKDFATLLNYFRKNKKDFKQFFSGSSEAKVNLLYELLAKDKMTISAEALKDLQRSHTNPDPAPFVIKIPLDDPKLLREQGGWKAEKARFIYEMFLNIHVAEISFEFSDKEITFIPSQNIFRIHLMAKKVSIRGFDEEIGQFKYIHHYSKGPLVRRWKKWKYLKLGEIENMAVDIALKLSELEDGNWQLSLAEPLSLRLSDTIRPQVHLITFVNKTNDHINVQGQKELKELQELVKTYNDTNGSKDLKKEDKWVPLPAYAIGMMQSSLAETIEGALASVLFPESLGVQVPFYGRAETDGVDGEVNLQTKLSKLNFTSDGMVFDFSTRLFLKDAATCVSSDELPALGGTKADFKLNGDLSSNEHWTLKSIFAEDKKEGEKEGEKVISPRSSAWFSEGQEPVEQSSFVAKNIQVEMLPNFLEQLNRTLYLAGRYCLSTRFWKDRSGSIPLVELDPRRIYGVNLAKDEMKFSFNVDMQTLHRNGKDLNEKFELIKDSKIPLSFDVVLSIDQKNKKIAFDAPRNLNFNDFSAEESRFFENLKEVLLNSMMGPKAKENKTPEDIADCLKRKNISFSDFGHCISIPEAYFKEIKLDEDSAKFSIDLDFRFLSQEQEQESSKPKLIEVPAPLTKLKKGLPQWTDNQFFNFDWSDSNSDLYFSWRLVSKNTPSSEWSPFQRWFNASPRLKVKGDYEFQIKAMNQNYEIEKTPQTHWFYYDGLPIEEPKQEEEIVWPLPQKSKIKLKPLVSKVEVKLAFSAHLPYKSALVHLNFFRVLG